MASLYLYGPRARAALEFMELVRFSPSLEGGERFLFSPLRKWIHIRYAIGNFVYEKSFLAYFCHDGK